MKAGQTFSFDSAATGDPAPTPTWQISQDGGTTWQTLETGRADVTFTLPKSPAAGAARLAAAGSPQDLVRVVYQGATTVVAALSAATPDYVPANNSLSLSTLIK